MQDIIIDNIENLPYKERNGINDYGYLRRDLLPRGFGGSIVSLYELLPGKTAYPYHYHLKNEEFYYILSGEGNLRTPLGERKVSAGDFVYFPPNEKGAHKLTNTSETENLVYLDFDTSHDLEVAVYPDSDKIGIWGKDINRLYKIDDDVDYFEGEK